MNDGDLIRPLARVNLGHLEPAIKTFCGTLWPSVVKKSLNHRSPQSPTEIEVEPEPGPQTQSGFRDTGFAHATEADLSFAHCYGTAKDQSVGGTNCEATRNRGVAPA